MQKSFILVQEYPGSPEINSVVLELKTFSNNTKGYILASDIQNIHTKIYSVQEIENFPNFWKSQSS